MNDSRIIQKPWGQEELLEHNSRYVLKKLVMTAGHRCSLQYHEQKHETIFVLSGLLRVSFGTDVHKLDHIDLTPGASIVLEPHVIHRMEALDDSVYLEASTPELDDVIRLSDDYNR